MNNKSRIALAIATAFGTVALGASSGAFAQTSTVQIGGSFNLFYAESKPGTPLIGGKKHDNLSLSEPEMWIHGEEKIGSMTAWFRCTSSFDLIGTSAANTTGAGQFCGRNSALGFKGDWGNVFAGTWDTPHKMVNNSVRGWWGGTASLTGGYANVLLNGAASNVGNTGANFYSRRSRLISYHSPSFSGFSFKGAYSASNESTALTTAALQSLSPRMFGASVQYDNGPLYIGVGYEQNNDFNPSGAVVGPALGQYNGGSDKNWLIGAVYTFGTGTRLAGLWTTSKYETTNTTELKKDGWVIFVDQRISGPHKVLGQYYQVGDSKGNSAVAAGFHSASGANTGAKGWSLAYMYEMSKRTEVGFVYGIVDNEAAANYSKAVSAAAAGTTQKVYGLNVRHRF